MSALASVAQWIEQEPSNLLVGGSTPSWGAMHNSPSPLGEGLFLWADSPVRVFGSLPYSLDTDLVEGRALGSSQDSTGGWVKEDQPESVSQTQDHGNKTAHVLVEIIQIGRDSQLV